MPGEVSSRSEQWLRRGLQLASAAFLLWLYVGDLVRVVRAQFAEVAVLHALPSWPLSLLGSAVAIAFAVTHFLSPRQPPEWRPRRLSAIGAVVLIFVDFLVLSPRRSNELPEFELAGAVGAMTEDLNRLATLERVPTEPRAFEKALASLGPVPIFVKGERVPAWKLELHRNCTAPETKPSAPGTLIFCVSPDATHGWVTLTATEGAATFGAPGIIGAEAPWVGEVTVAVPQPPEPPEDTVWQQPTPDDEP